MKTLTFDDIKVTKKSVETMGKYKSVLESLGPIIKNKEPDDVIEKIIKNDVAEEDQELITAFVDMSIAMNRYIEVAGKEV